VDNIFELLGGELQQEYLVGLRMMEEEEVDFFE
jgi:hypothetical protein